MPDTEVELSVGTLTPPACYATEQDRVNAYVAAMSATVPGGYFQWILQTALPSAGQQGYIWERTDVNGYPLEALNWVTAAAKWIRWFALNKFPVTSVGAANAYAITFNPTFDQYKTGEVILFVAGTTNTGPATLQVDALAAIPIKKKFNQALAPGDILVGQVVMGTYDGASFQMISAHNIVDIADFAAGTDGQTLRTRTVAAVLASVWETSVYGTAAGGEQAIPAAGAAVTFTHGLQISGAAVAPKGYQVKIVCTDAGGNATYAQGDEINWGDVYYNDGTVQAYLTSYQNSSVIGAVRNSTITHLYVDNKAGGVGSEIDTTKWKVKASAYI